jgi:GTP-binding protein HflX
LLLHVVDISHPEAEAQIAAVDTVLQELDACDIPMVMVFNKIDQLEKEDQFHILKSRYPEAIPISAQRGDGIETLMETLAQRFALHGALLNLSIPYTEGKALDMLYKHGTVLGTEYAEDAVHVKARLPSRYLKSVSQFSVKDTL